MACIHARKAGLPERIGLWLLSAGLLLTAPHAAQAQLVNSTSPTTVVLPAGSSSKADAASAIVAPPRTNLFGDAWGLRPQLNAAGIALGVVETSEVFGNLTGGRHRGAAYDGATQLSLGVNLEKEVGWPGATFNASAYQLHGRNLSADNLVTLQSSTGIEAQRSTRLWELWLQQTFLGGKLSLRLGQQSLDQEFIVSAGSTVFINTAMGWPVVPSVDLYAGGPAYPLASLGARVQVQATTGLVVLAGVFDDNPAGGNSFADASPLRGSAQSGTAFNLDTGALCIAELQYTVVPFGVGSTGGLRGVYKLGGWFDTGRFPDQRFDSTGLSLADDLSTQDPRMHAGNWSVYAVADQAVWQPDRDGPRVLGVFARVLAAPADRNLASFSINAGLTLKQPLAGRDNDIVGIGFGVVKIGRQAARLDADVARFSQDYSPVRTSESFAELTYQAQVTAWLILQPDFQYVLKPGGGIANPDAPGRIGDEAVLGVRSTVIF